MKGGRDPRNVLIAGAGAVGQFVGARLQQGGHLVTLLTRSLHADAIRANGLRITGLTDLHGHLDCITDVAQAQVRYDAVIVTSKAYATADVAKQVAPVLDRDAILVSLQNGFGNGGKVAAAAASPDKVAIAVTSHGIMVQEPGVLVHAGTGPTIVGPHAPTAATAAAAATAATVTTAHRAHALLSDAGLEPASADGMRGHVWRKALVNHAVNPLSALEQVPNGRLLKGKLWEQCEELALEGFAVARAAGVALPDVADGDALVALVRTTLERTSDNRNSMVQDMGNRRPTEIEQISGRLVRLARRLGHPAFASEDVYHLVKDAEAQYLGGAESLRRTREEVQWENAPF